MQPAPQIDFSKIGEESAALLQQFAGTSAADMESMSSITKSFFNLAAHMMANPQKMWEAQMELYKGYMNLWAAMADRMMGKEASPVAEPEKGDRRFSHQGWQENLIFDYIKQSYLLTSQWMVDNVRDVQGVDEKDKLKVDFYVRQFLDAVSPSNFPHTNPEVLQKTVETRGENLVKGLQNILDDLQRGKGKLKISMTDYDAFKVGENIAVTEGEVVYRSRMFELIQYKPKNTEVFERPLLIFPPWINKFYILDLQPKNSFIRYAVEECGLNVFLVSWKNVDASYRDVGWEDYIKDGIFDAIEQVTAITGSKDVNAIGYCMGGTLLSTALAVMAKKKDKRVNSATFFTTLMDFSEAGELGVFIDEQQVQSIEKRMNERGYMDGAEMAQTFAMLRANDLIWSFVVNNYLLGEDPFPFDLLYWNDDPTRLPCKMHSFYLRNMYLENNLMQKDKLTLLGEKIDLGNITLPKYMVTAVNDHITPWHSCYKSAAMLGGDTRFILGRAGHVAGVVAPPTPGKGFFWAADAGHEKDPEAWKAKAKQNEGSWWTDWKEWIASQSGAKVPAPKQLGDAKHKPLCKAPGTYVVEK